MSPPLRERPAAWLLFAALVWLGGILFSVSRFLCLRAWLAYGMIVPVCPAGRPQQTVEVESLGLRRGAPGTLRVRARAHYSQGPADQALEAGLRRYSCEARLLGPEGQELALEPEGPWKKAWGDARHRLLSLPEGLPDGDYKLAVRVHSPLGDSEQDLALPLYAPAAIHVLTDRPLYEPGNVVQFRALALRARDLGPLDGRPGRWVLRDPEGETLLEESAPAGEWGVVAGSFPLDSEAATGEWRVRWESGGASDEVVFRVEPFTLPRMRLEASALQPFYRAGEQPLLRGALRYSSGAPVADAALELSWSAQGEWPLPTAWKSDGPDALPRRARSDSSGAFELRLPRIPGDLQGQVRLLARLVAVDATGDRVEGGAQVLLARDAIAAAAVTELEEGLVEGFNNRLYLRLTTADGRPLPNARVEVRRAWDPSDEGQSVVTDEDAVAALQIDPGPPVNVVLPPLPVRPPPPVVPVQRRGLRDLLGDGTRSLADQIALDRLLGLLVPCARFAERGAASGRVALRVDGGGRVRDAVAAPDDASRCLAAALRDQRLAPGGERLYAADFLLQDPGLPRLLLEMNAEPELPPGLGDILAAASRDARTCLPEDAAGGPLGWVLDWKAEAGRRTVKASWLPDPRSRGRGLAAPAVQRCLRERFAALELPEEAPRPALGVLRWTVEPSPRLHPPRPQAQTFLGYELGLRAFAGERELGSTRLLLRPGQVPPLRLRTTPVLARPGEELKVELLRGPGFSGLLPKKLYLRLPTGRSLPADLDPETRSATFTLPADVDGWLSIEWSSARSLVFVPKPSLLTLELGADREEYAPGEQAQISLHTKVAGKGSPAAVGLFGVDESLAQLVPLPGPDALERLRPGPETPSPAFGALDGQALAMGRVRGTNAAAATILRVSHVPQPAELDVAVHASATSPFDPVEVLTDRFYALLPALHERVRRWEREAPPKELMRPATMAALWREVLGTAAGAAGQDAYGRPLRLSLLPSDLLELAGPRAVVVEGTRLPEDVEDWGAWVRRSQP